MSRKQDPTLPEGKHDSFLFGSEVYLVVVSALVMGAATLLAYWPALTGPFVFDDLYLPFSDPGAASWALSTWVTGVRPVLMFSYWLNYHSSGLAPLSYHALNISLHLLTSGLVFLIVLKIQEWAGIEYKPRFGLSLFAAGLFLLHPVQSEAVAYIAGRSEVLSVLFGYAAFAVFLYARNGVSALRALAILLLIGLGFLSKEHVIVLPFLFLLTDLYWNRDGAAKVLKRNGLLYAAMLLVAAPAAFFITKRVLSGTQSAGFHLSGLSWGQYAFTEWRAIWVYLRLFFLPFAQCADYDFPVSHTPFDRGAFVSLAGLVAIIVIGLLARNRYRAASYGLFVFLLLLAPTSSFFPIADPLVERRLYLPCIGLIITITELLRRSLPNRVVLSGTLIAILTIAALLAHERNKVWSSPLALWVDTVEGSPNKFRPRFQLAYAYAHAGNCAKAVEQYEVAARLGPPDYRMLVDWALAYDCVGQPNAAVAKLNEAATINATAHVYSQIGLVFAKQGKRAEALDAFDRAEGIDPDFEATYVYRGIFYTEAREFTHAEADFRKALALNPNNPMTRRGLSYVTKERSTGARP